MNTHHRIQSYLRIAASHGRDTERIGLPTASASAVLAMMELKGMVRNWVGCSMRHAERDYSYGTR